MIALKGMKYIETRQQEVNRWLALPIHDELLADDDELIDSGGEKGHLLSSVVFSLRHPPGSSKQFQTYGHTDENDWTPNSMALKATRT